MGPGAKGLRAERNKYPHVDSEIKKIKNKQR